MKTAAVVTVTNGKRMEELLKCTSSIFHQTYPVTHYILCDGDFYSFERVREHCVNSKVCYWAMPIGWLS